MALTADDVLALAPDAASVAAGRKAARPADWRELGQDGLALWGKCQGSALYAVWVDRSDHATRCSCPSRKFPCKHGLGLLLLSVEGKVPSGSAPAEVSGWLAGRTARATKKAETAAAPVDPAAARDREERRMESVAEGARTLRRWLGDLVRDGIASAEQGYPFDRHAARLVDAKAGGIATRVRELPELIDGKDDWPSRLLDELGLLALLAEAVSRHDELPAALAQEVRSVVGIPVATEAVLATGRRTQDVWRVAAAVVEDDGRLVRQRVWLVGQTTGETALVLQFGPMGSPLPQRFVVGGLFSATVVRFPDGQRALLEDRVDGGEPAPLQRTAGVEHLLDELTDTLAARPWCTRFGAALTDVVPSFRPDGALLIDTSGLALPVIPSPDLWVLVAVSGGQPLDTLVEWCPEGFRVRAAFVGSRQVPLSGGA